MDKVKTLGGYLVCLAINKRVSVLKCKEIIQTVSQKYLKGF